ncbi:hypothetical protein [Paenibacillus sp. NPDC058071]|uniref:hypothetical protein n=1 Tax=Paenibacillus sp. NPDC058071 TaxID=3346326 RepID=UPI0036D8C1F0
MLEKVHRFYYLGGLIGLVVGYMFAKVYQSWAILYQVNRLDPNMQNSWPSNGPPIWIIATEKPAAFSFWTVVIFIAASMIAVKLFFNPKNKPATE